VAGVSAGSIIGSLYCAGVSTARMLEMSRDMHWRSIASPVWPRDGLVSFARLARWLIQVTGDCSFSDLSTPLAIGVTDLETCRPSVINSGKVAVAVHASCAVPGFVVPVRHQGRLLGDGGISHNLPAAAARAMGADYVIGVDLMQPQLRKRGGPFRYGLAALEVMIEQSGGGTSAVDCLIEPDLAGLSYFNVRQFDDLVSRGQRAAAAQLDTIRAALG
jgi:NTE family protein